MSEECDKIKGEIYNLLDEYNKLTKEYGELGIILSKTFGISKTNVETWTEYNAKNNRRRTVGYKIYELKEKVFKKVQDLKDCEMRELE